MRLVNFELSKPSYSIELIGLDTVWDLHNNGHFRGIDVNPNDNTAVMKWTLLGNTATTYSGCNLIFQNLKLLLVSPRDDEFPYSEDLCISGISKIIPDHAEKPEYRTKRRWRPSDTFHLLFQFESQRSIEINAESVELAGISKSTRR